jgi:hypothetical protein
MWSIAVYDLGLTSEDFYSLTPRKYDALVKRWEREREHSEFMLAQLTSSVINFSTCRPKESVKPQELMPSQWGKTPQPKKVRITKARKKAITDTIHGGFAMLLARSKR